MIHVEHAMKKPWIRVCHTSALAISLLGGCQLNDHDSAPLAPDGPYDPEESVSAAQAGAAGAGARTSTPSTDAGTSVDASASQSSDGSTPTIASDAGALDGASDANVTPMFPSLPGFEAGSLPPGNFGTQGDAADGSAFPNG
jgi:hypothetical protein